MAPKIGTWFTFRVKIRHRFTRIIVWWRSFTDWLEGFQSEGCLSTWPFISKVLLMSCKMVHSTLREITGGPLFTHFSDSRVNNWIFILTFWHEFLWIRNTFLHVPAVISPKSYSNIRIFSRPKFLWVKISDLSSIFYINTGYYWLYCCVRTSHGSCL